MADKAFFTGAAAEIPPIRSVDAMPVGDGSRGPVTARLQAVFAAAVRGRYAYSADWLTFVSRSAQSPAKSEKGAA